MTEQILCARAFTDADGDRARCTRPAGHNDSRDPKQWGHKGEKQRGCRVTKARS